MTAHLRMRQADLATGGPPTVQQLRRGRAQRLRLGCILALGASCEGRDPPGAYLTVSFSDLTSPGEEVCELAIIPDAAIQSAIEITWQMSAVARWGDADRHTDITMTLEVLP